MKDNEKDFWLLRDYAYGDLEEAFYKKHAEEVMKAICKIDISKSDNNEIVSFLKNEIKKYE
jgi:hypothetical protein